MRNIPLFLGRCFPNEFTCENGECVPAGSRCDRRPDCRDRSDERDCGPAPGQCQSNEFTCGTGQCIPSYRKCDRRIDCSDGSDEAQCRKYRSYMQMRTINYQFHGI